MRLTIGLTTFFQFAFLGFVFSLSSAITVPQRAGEMEPAW
jgi:hypothetical protein